MSYVDGFVVPVPKDKLDAYIEMSTKCGQLWRELGALEYREYLADDVKPGKLTSFPQSVDLKDDEVVVFSYIVYSSREERDRINAAVMQDPLMKEMSEAGAMPFDGKRLIYGGFEKLVEL